MGKTTERPSYRAWYEKNRERLAEQRRTWRIENAEHVKEQSRLYKKANREKLNADSLARYYADPKAGQETRRRYRQNLREKVIAAYGSACACCGETRVQFLALDHVNGDGSIERRTLKTTTGTHIYLHAIRLGYPDTYRILCHNCNSSFGYYGFCPHERERLALAG